MAISRLILAVFITFGVRTISEANLVTNSTCRCMPGDLCWPDEDTWMGLNKSVGGRLIATIPLGSPCHDPTYDAQACRDLQAVRPRAETEYVYRAV